MSVTSSSEVQHVTLPLTLHISNFLSPSTGTLKSHSNGPLYSNTVIGTLAIDGWAVTFGTARRGLGLLAVPNTAHPSTASVPVPTSYCLMWHYNCLYTLTC